VKNIVEPDRPQMKIWRVAIACWVTKATLTLPEYVMLIASPRQIFLQEQIVSFNVHTLPVFFSLCLDMQVTPQKTQCDSIRKNRRLFTLIIEAKKNNETKIQCEHVNVEHK
jgi:hypothetical protein